MQFSQREGIKPAKKTMQIESIDSDLRNGLWNVLTILFWDTYESPGDDWYAGDDTVKHSNLEILINQIWIHHFKRPIDTINTYWEECNNFLRDYFFQAEWWEVLDFIEFIAKYSKPSKTKEAYIRLCNFNFDRENSAYRFIDGAISTRTSKEEINAIENAIEKSTPFGGVKTHLKRAIALHSDRLNPDYRNSIKESISAVESLAKHISSDGKGTLGAILKQLEQDGKIHPALKNAFSSLYGYTSDADGIRHAMLEEDNITKTEARFMLICCSAFINYVIERNDTVKVRHA